MPDRNDTLPTQVAISDILTPEFEDFMDYWSSLRGGAFAPSWEQFDLLALDPKSIPRVVVVDVHRDPLDVVVRFWGTGHVQRKGFDKTGKSIAGTPTIRGPTAFSEGAVLAKRDAWARIAGCMREEAGSVVGSVIV